jgi:hypothetical protein
MNKLFGVISIAIVIAATAVTFSNDWPSALINQWQVKIMGGNSYFPALTIFIIAIPLLLILHLCKLVVLRLSKKQQ